MVGELDPFDFVLAEKLHCTVEEMRHRISNIEYHRWRGFFTYRDTLMDFEIKKAQAKSGKR